MRNLKRALSLGLASSMVLGTMAFSASAATSTSVTPTEVQTSFNDNDTISPENVNSIYIAEQIKLTEGKDGGIFDPNGTVTRMEMAVICVNMKFGVDYATANFSEGDAANPQFSDLTWGYEFAKVAAQEGIIYGVGEDSNGQMMFNPDGKVIAADALLMILKTLGYFKNPSQEFSVDYKYAAGARATELSLYDEKEYALIEELSREEVYAVAVRALTTCARVDYNYETGNYYNESAGYNSALLPNNNIVEDTLGYQKFDLKAVDSVDSFNRPTTLWTISSKEIANFVVDEHLDSDGNSMVYTTAKTYQEIAKELSSVTKDSNEDYYDYGVFVDGMEYGEWMLANGYDPEEEIIATTTTLEGFNSVISTKNTGHFVPSNNGVLTQVFVEEPVEYFDTQGNWKIEKGKVHVTCINTFLAEVRSTYDYGNGEYGTTIRYYKEYLKDSNNQKEGVEYDAAFDVDVITTEEFVVGDVVMVQISAKDAQAAPAGGYSDDDVDIIHINYPETETGNVTEVKLSADSVGGMYFDIDDIHYDYSVAMRGDLSDLNETMAPSPDAEIIAYFDDNVQENGQGYVLGYKVVEQTPKYLYVEECDGDGFSFYDGSTARVTFADGEEKIIQISHIDGEQVGWDNYTTIPTGSRFKTESGAWIAPNENFVVETENNGDVTIYTDSIENRIFGYEETTDAQGNPSYNIITTIQKAYTEEDGASKGGLLAMTTKTRLDETNESTRIGTNHSSYGTLDFTSTGLTVDGAPVKDTMAVFTSVYMPSQMSKDDTYTSYYWPNSDEYGDDNAVYGGEVNYYSVVANPNNVASYDNYNTPESYYNFSLYSGEIAGFVMEADAEGSRAYHDTDENDIGGGHIITGDMSTEKHDHLFLIDENTVFIDVVSSGAVPLSYKDIEDMDNGDLNMQVIFGEGGYADTVFISYGIPVEDIGATDYVIFQDAKAKAKTENGITYYYYDVWVDGKEDTIRSRSNEIVVTNDVWKDDEENEPLQTNTLYKISKFDSMNELVIEVEYEYDYSPLFTARYNDETREDIWGTMAANTKEFNDVYNNLWSVATSVTGSSNSYTTGSLQLAYDDDYADLTSTGNGLMDSGSVLGANLFSYDEDTIFMVIDVTTDGKLKSVSRGDAGDIITYRDDDDHYVSWVDVVSAEKKNSVHTPYAELIVVVNPYTRGVIPQSDNGYEGDCANILKYDRDTIAEGGLTSGTIENQIRIENVVHKEYAASDITQSERLKYDVIAQILCDYFDEDAGDTWEVYYENNLEIKWSVTNSFGTQYYSFHIDDAVSEEDAGDLEQNTEDAVYPWSSDYLEVDNTYYVALDDGVFYINLNDPDAVEFYYTGDEELSRDEILKLARDAIFYHYNGNEGVATSFTSSFTSDSAFAGFVLTTDVAPMAQDYTIAASGSATSPTWKDGITSGAVIVAVENTDGRELYGDDGTGNLAALLPQGNVAIVYDGSNYDIVSGTTGKEPATSALTAGAEIAGNTDFVHGSIIYTDVNYTDLTSYVFLDDSEDGIDDLPGTFKVNVSADTSAHYVDMDATEDDVFTKDGVTPTVTVELDYTGTSARNEGALGAMFLIPKDSYVGVGDGLQGSLNAGETAYEVTFKDESITSRNLVEPGKYEIYVKSADTNTAETGEVLTGVGMKFSAGTTESFILDGKTYGLGVKNGLAAGVDQIAHAVALYGGLYNIGNADSIVVIKNANDEYTAKSLTSWSEAALSDGDEILMNYVLIDLTKGNGVDAGFSIISGLEANDTTILDVGADLAIALTEDGELELDLSFAVDELNVGSGFTITLIDSDGSTKNLEVEYDLDLGSNPLVDISNASVVNFASGRFVVDLMCNLNSGSDPVTNAVVGVKFTISGDLLDGNNLDGIQINLEMNT